MGHVGSKTRLLDQILVKPCARCRNLILVQVIMKLGQNVCFEDSRTCLKMGYVGSKTRSLGQIFESQSRGLR